MRWRAACLLGICKTFKSKARQSETNTASTLPKEAPNKVNAPDVFHDIPEKSQAERGVSGQGGATTHFTQDKVNPMPPRRS
eukprot:5962240-Amphidinium_carterae.1